MITPVENGRTAPDAQPSAAATAAHVASAAAIPGSPVPALALPALTISARRPVAASPSTERCRRQTVTGAAQKRFCVNTPAAVVPASKVTSSTSSRCQFLIRAAAVPSSTPGTGRSCSAVGGV